MMNSFKISIKQAIFVIFSITVLLFLSLTLLTQYYFSQKNNARPKSCIIHYSSFLSRIINASIVSPTGTLSNKAA